MSLRIWKGPTTGLVAASNATTWEYGDRVRVTDVYHGVTSLCSASLLARGTFGTGIRAGWVVNKSSAVSAPSGGTLTIEWEAGGASATQPLPAGSFSLKPQELYPKIERNAYFAGTSGVSGAPTTAILYSTIQLAYNALYAANQTGSAGAYSAGLALTGDQLLHFNKLLSKLLRGEETYYLAGWRYTYEVFSYATPTVSRGGSVGTPGGPLSGSLPAGVAWMRLADDLDPAGVNGSMYKLNVTWLGGPSGHWDTDIYP